MLKWEAVENYLISHTGDWRFYIDINKPHYVSRHGNGFMYGVKETIALQTGHIKSVLILLP